MTAHLLSSSSNSSSPALLSSKLPVPSDWSVPHASRLKYRQQFNSLDKQMTGYLTGEPPPPPLPPGVPP